MKNYVNKIAEFEKFHMNNANTLFQRYKFISQSMPKAHFNNVYDAAFAILSRITELFRVKNYEFRFGNEIFHNKPGRYNLIQLLGSSHDYSEITRFFRGLSSVKHKNITPMDRPANNAEHVSNELRRERHYRIEHFRKYLRNNFTLYNDIFSAAKPEDIEFLELAFMQHFKSEACLHPPLLDITYDPLTALYFASSNPKDGEIGIVYMVSKNDVNDMESIASVNFQAAILSDITRISRQRGFIIDSLSAGVFEANIPYKITFDQHANVRYLDSDIAIDDSHNLDDDNIAKGFCLDYASKFKSLATDLAFEVEEPPLLFDKVRTNMHEYAETQKSEYKVEPDVIHDRIDKLINFHQAAITTGEFPINWTSLRNIRRAVDNIATCSFITVIDYYQYIHYSDDNERKKSFYKLWDQHMN